MKKETIHTKACPRCGAPFVCRPDNPSICQCAGVVLNENARAYLRTHYKDCLCRRCLEEIADFRF